MQATSTADAAHEAAGFTGRFTAGLRFVESTCVPHPLLPSDPLAGALAGDRGLALAKQELEQLTRDQGPGKHLRVPARSRLIDDILEQEMARLRAAAPHGSGPDGDADGPSASAGSAQVSSRHCRHCQVVSLGAGMCTRPWRLPCLAGCAVFELDLPHIAATKAALLAEVGAQTSRASDTSARIAASLQSSSCSGGPLEGGDGDGGRNPTAAAPASAAAVPQQQQPQQRGEGGGPASGPPTQNVPQLQQQGRQQQQGEEEEEARRRFPLLAASYACIGVDLSDAATTTAATSAAAAGSGGRLAAVLAGAGFDPSMPTIWVLEALLYYMPLAAASELLCALARLSAAGSRLVATCVDRELLEASLRGVPKGHVFADLWHFEAEALLYDTRAFGECWQIDWTGQPEPEAGDDTQGAGDDAAGASDAHQRRRLPASTRLLAKERLGADTYVALYGGSELLFVAGLRPREAVAAGCEPWVVKS